MQTRWQSFFESCINVAIGYGVALMSPDSHLPAVWHPYSAG